MAKVTSGNANVINASVTATKNNGIGWIVLTRPDQINAINDEIRHGVPQALLEFDSDPDVGVVVVRGEGQRGFCAGADIKEKRGAETAIEVRERMQNSRWIETIDQIGKPVIAAVHGYCMGGGLELALACDIRFAAPDIVMSLPETGLGLIPGGGGTQRLPRTVGLAKALDMMLTGARVKAQEALQIGLVTRVAASDSTLIEEVSELAASVAAKPPIATRYLRRAARAAVDLELSRGLDLELDLFATLKTSEDAREAAAAFKEKRSPNFVGK